MDLGNILMKDIPQIIYNESWHLFPVLGLCCRACIGAGWRLTFNLIVLP